MRKLRISFKSFERGIETFYVKRILKSPIHVNLLGNIKDFDIVLDKLIKNYKCKPFRDKSAYTLKDIGEHKLTYRISYTFKDDQLYFKLLVRRGSRFVRISQLIVKNLHK